jgi:sugar lactone lactonase YvrE
MNVEQVTDPVVRHGEGPVWSERWGGLRWVDMFAGDVVSLGSDGAIHRLHVGEYVSALRPRRAGGAVYAGARRFFLEEPAGELHELAEMWADENIVLNDAACDPDGRFYCGSLAQDRRPDAGRLYRMDPDRTIRVVLEPVWLSNGLDWSPDGSRSYYVDSGRSRIDTFDYSPEQGLTNKRPFATIEVEGDPRIRPDGLTVDSEGGVWVALCCGGEIRRYSGSGRLDEVVTIPARKVTACTFGGARLDQLFITTSRYNVAPGEDRFAGSLFRADVGVRGQPVREFAG